MPLCPSCDNNKLADAPCHICGFCGAAEGYVTFAIQSSDRSLVSEAHLLAALNVKCLLDAQDIRYDLIAIN